MSDNLNVLFYVRKNYVNKAGKSGVMIRITLNGKVIQFSANLDIAPQDWDERAKKMRGRTEQANTFNQTLCNIQSKIYENFKLFPEHKIKRTVENLRDSIIQKDFFEKLKEKQSADGSVYFIDVYKNNIVDKAKTIGTLIEKITWDKYDRTFRKMSEFVYFCYKNTDPQNIIERDKFVKRKKPAETEVTVKTKKGPKRIKIDIAQPAIKSDTYIDIPISNIDYKFVKDFETYLAVELKLQHNSKSKEMQNFQGFIAFALNMQWLQRDPFHNVRITFVESDREYLPEEDLKKIMARSFSIERLEQVRDIFLFCCYTGFAFTDAMNLTTNCIQQINGKLWIGKDREKTKVDENVPLLNVPLAIIQKYEGIFDEYILPRISNQKTNAYLKEIADLCGITKNLTTHIARHTFATLAINNDIPLEVVGKMLGHKKLSTTTIYAKILHKTVSDNMDKFSNRISKLSETYVTN